MQQGLRCTACLLTDLQEVPTTVSSRFAKSGLPAAHGICQVSLHGTPASCRRPTSGCLKSTQLEIEARGLKQDTPIKQIKFLPKYHCAHYSDEVLVGVTGVQLRIQAASLLPLPHVDPRVDPKWLYLRKLHKSCFSETGPLYQNQVSSAEA